MSAVEEIAAEESGAEESGAEEYIPLLKSIDYRSKGSRARTPFPIKKYATDGENIPLNKNWSETWCTLSAHYETVGNLFLNFEVRDDDVFVVTFMKCGTTWMQECAWLLLNELNYVDAREILIMTRSPFLEFHGISPELQNHLLLCERLRSPRLIKTHLPANLLPVQIWEKKRKIIYVARNVKDVIVSSYHFVKNLHMWQGDNLPDYVEDFLNGDILYSHFWTHIVDFWKMRHEPFIFFVTYEEMSRDLAGVIRKLCVFLERPQLNEKEMDKLVDHLSFNRTNKNNLKYYLSVQNPFAEEEFQFKRRGIVGSFKDELTPELQAKIDSWTAKYLSKHGLTEEDIFGKI